MAKLKTGRHTSALKAARQAEKHTVSNTTVRSRINTIARKVEEAVAQKDAKTAKALLNDAFSAWDRAAKVGVVHHRSASRKKARLSLRVQGIQSAKS